MLACVHAYILNITVMYADSVLAISLFVVVENYIHEIHIDCRMTLSALMNELMHLLI